MRLTTELIQTYELRKKEDSSFWRCARIRIFFRALSIFLAGVQTFAARNAISPDGRSYLELARAYLRHDWAMTINGYWSPFYAWLLALVLGIVKPSIRLEYPTVHILNLFLFIVALVAFEFFWSTILTYRNSLALNAKGTASFMLSDSQLWILGYSYFIWAIVGNLLFLINPDLCLASVILVAAALLTRIKLEWKSTIYYLLLGFTLAVGYLLKAIMFPLAFIFLAIVFFVRKSKEHYIRTAYALIIFLLLCAPQVFLLSSSQHRFTFSNTGNLAFLWYNYDLPLRNWQGNPPGSGVPIHPTRVLWSHPPVFEYSAPIRASYPPWYDPGYWNAGMVHPFQLSVVIQHTIPRIKTILFAFVEPKAWLLGLLLIFLWADIKATTKNLCNYWHLIVPVFVICAMYSVTWVEYRYLAVWEILFWACVLSSFYRRPHVSTDGVYTALTVLIALILTASIAYGSWGQIIHGRRDDATPEYITAEGLLMSGLHENDKVAAIGFDNDIHWAYLAGFKVVAEINSDVACQFWSAPPVIQKQMLQKLETVNVKAVVVNLGGSVMSTMSTAPPKLQNCSASHPEWQHIPGSPNEVFIFHDK